jgi:ABC-type amino acid transport system permease subunit
MVNTLRVSLLGIIMATIFGTLIGVGRVSRRAPSPARFHLIKVRHLQGCGPTES